MAAECGFWPRSTRPRRSERFSTASASPRGPRRSHLRFRKTQTGRLFSEQAAASRCADGKGVHEFHASSSHRCKMEVADARRAPGAGGFSPRPTTRKLGRRRSQASIQKKGGLFRLSLPPQSLRWFLFNGAHRLTDYLRLGTAWRGSWAAGASTGVLNRIWDVSAFRIWRLPVS